MLALTIDQVRELNEAARLDIGKTDEAEDEVEAYEAGDTGWIVTHSRFTFGDGSWAANRVVSVVVRDHEDGGWKSVLTTSQLLVPNELLEADSPLRGRPRRSLPGSRPRCYPPVTVSVRGRDESGSMPVSVMSSVSM